MVVIKPLEEIHQFFSFKLGDLIFQVNDSRIELKNGNGSVELVSSREAGFRLLHFDSSESVIWISFSNLDRQISENNFIKFGYGETLETNIIAHYTFDHKEGFKSISIDNIAIDSKVEVVESICLNDPFVKDFEPLIFPDKESVPIKELNKNYKTKEDHPEFLQLYEKINKVYITKIVSDAIEYSIETQGCALNKKLIEKSGGFGDSKTTYIRVPLGPNFGNQPGQPYVLEIWPKGHYSPIHNHGNAVALIKLLCGKLKTEWFNPLAEENSKNPKVIKTGFINAGNIAWMTPFNYQTHKLTNEGNSVAISIQAYAHTDSNTGKVYSETFNYIKSGDPELHHFYPNEDFSYDNLERIVLEEYTKHLEVFIYQIKSGTKLF